MFVVNVFHQVRYEMLISSGGDRITEKVEPIKDEFALHCLLFSFYEV